MTARFTRAATPGRTWPEHTSASRGGWRCRRARAAHPPIRIVPGQSDVADHYRIAGGVFGGWLTEVSRSWPDWYGEGCEVVGVEVDDAVGAFDHSADDEGVAGSGDAAVLVPEAG